MNPTTTPKPEAKHSALPWRINPDAPLVIFHATNKGKAIAAVSGNLAYLAQEPMKGFLGDTRMMTDEEFAESEKEGWEEERRAEMEANARLIVTAVNHFAEMRDALEAAERAFDGSNIRLAHEHANTLGLIRAILAKIKEAR